MAMVNLREENGEFSLSVGPTPCDRDCWYADPVWLEALAVLSRPSS